MLLPGFYQDSVPEKQLQHQHNAMTPLPHPNKLIVPVRIACFITYIHVDKRLFSIYRIYKD